jgi:hypothetical protein
MQPVIRVQFVEVLPQGLRDQVRSPESVRGSVVATVDSQGASEQHASLLNRPYPFDGSNGNTITMSEYQFVHFVALDRPLTDDQLCYMSKQSTRAEITKWEFTNEYHYGDFHGNAKEMMRRGYDLHLHYANFGIRRLMIRLPAGLPWDKPTFKTYRPKSGLEWHPDKQGRGGILEINPEGDAATFDYYGPVEDLLAEVAPIRDHLISGDLRPLYVIWLAIAAIQGDDDTLEPPVPAGLATLPDCLMSLAAFYELDSDLLKAAAKNSLPLLDAPRPALQTSVCLARQTKDELKSLLQRFLDDDPIGVRAETLALIRDKSGGTQWPTTEPTRTIKQLIEMGEELTKSRSKRSSATKRRTS